MNKAIITAARPERLKIVAFLLRLADWEVKVYNRVSEAVNYLKNADNNGLHYDLLVVADYSSLGSDEKERLFESQCLEVCTTLQQPIAILVAANNISEHEHQHVAKRLDNQVEFCSTDHLISHVEEIHDQLHLQELYEQRSARPH